MPANGHDNDRCRRGPTAAYGLPPSRSPGLSSTGDRLRVRLLPGECFTVVRTGVTNITGGLRHGSIYHRTCRGAGYGFDSAISPEDDGVGSETRWEAPGRERLRYGDPGRGEEASERHHRFGISFYGAGQGLVP